MSDSMPYADIILIALIAGFILLRLRSVLGQKTGHEPESYRSQELLPPVSDPIVQLGEKLKQKLKEEAPEDTLMASIADDEIRKNLQAIKAADPGFSAQHFVTGAKGAFELVFAAFAKGDKQALANLMSPEIAKEFEAEIDRRSQLEEKLDSTLVAIESQDITEASLERGKARISMRFVSEQVTVKRDKAGAIIEGDPSHVEQVEDHWVFEREVAARNPNWRIVET